MIYNKVAKFMPYEVPLMVEPLWERFQDLLKYEDLSSLPIPSTITTPLKRDNEYVIESAIMTETESCIMFKQKYILNNNEEIDFPSSSQEEDRKSVVSQALLLQGNQSDTSS